MAKVAPDAGPPAGVFLPDTSTSPLHAPSREASSTSSMRASTASSMRASASSLHSSTSSLEDGSASPKPLLRMSWDDPFTSSKYQSKSSLHLSLRNLARALQVGVVTSIFFFMAIVIPLNPPSKSEVKPNLNYLAMMFILSFWAAMPRAIGVFYIAGEPQKFQTTGIFKHILPLAKYWCALLVPIFSTIVNLIPIFFNRFPVPFLMVVSATVFSVTAVTPLALLNFPKHIRNDPSLRARIKAGLRLYTPATSLIFVSLLFFLAYFKTPDIGGGILKAIVIGGLHIFGFANRYIIYKLALKPETPKPMDCLSRYYATVLLYLTTTFVLPSGTNYFIYIAYIVIKALAQVLPLLICSKRFCKWIKNNFPILSYEVDHEAAKSEAINSFASQFAVLVSVVMFIPFSFFYTQGYNKEYTFYYSFDQTALWATNAYIICDALVTIIVFAICRRYFINVHGTDPLIIGLENIDEMYWCYIVVTMVGTIFLFSVILRQVEIVYLFLPDLYG